MLLVTDKRTGKKTYVSAGEKPLAIQNQTQVEHIGTSPAVTGPSMGMQSALDMKAGTKTLTFQIKNTATTGDPLEVVLFDAYGAYAEANGYTKPAAITKTAKNFLETMFLEELKTGYVYQCFEIDYTITKPTDDISQFDNPISVLTHSANVKSSQPLPSINPTDSQNAYVNQINIKTMEVDFDINAQLALSTLVELDTTISITFHVRLKTA